MIDLILENLKKMELHQRIRMVRLSQNLTQAYVADELGIDTANYSRMERGGTKISTERIKLIACILDVEVNIFFNSENKDRHSKTETIILMKEILIELKAINRKLK